jgi:outer membrane protein assembly factor BamB
VNQQFWLGFEASPAIWRGHVFLADNGGHLICLNINTFEIVRMVDNLDDTNCTPVLAIEDGHPYIYISMAFSGFGWRAPADSMAPVPIRKIDAMTGEIVWETEHRSGTVRGVSGGVLATIAVGQHQLGDLIFASIARSPQRHTGLLVAINRFTGETVWELQTGSHGWGSPVIVYDVFGRGYIIHTELVGNMFLIDGLTGVVMDRMNLNGHIEATPAVFESTVVIGTRGQAIWGIRLT